ncbi:MAG: nuclear transport factor 2 family protein [Bacteroidota bacterium]
MKKIRLILVALACMTFNMASAQTSKEEAPIEEVIERLFKGMQAGDSAMVHSVFNQDITMATVTRNKENAPVLFRESSLAGFLKAVGTPHKEVWYEEIWGLKILVDGDFAQAWCDYAFYIDKNFSHCGVDAFQLHKGKDGWKIFHLADTRRKTGCNIPQEIQDKHK